MSNVLAVTVSDRLEDLLSDNGGFILLELGTLSDFFKKLHTVTLLLNKEDFLSVLVHFVEAHDVRVVEIFQNIDLIIQSDLFIFSEGELIDDLDSTQLAIGSQLSLLDFTEGTLAELFCHVVLGLEDLHVLILHNEVLVRSDDIILSGVNLLCIKG